MRKLALIAVLGAAVVTVAAGCGGDDGAAAGNSTDRAFAAAMVPHHQMAVEMAEIAERRAQHPELKRLATDIKAAQAREIKTLRQVAGELEHHGVKAGDLGVPEHMTGMGADMEVLENSKAFDRQFLAMMIPHHQGAIRMARVELREGQPGQLRRLARAIVTTQQREINQMRSWSKRWYGTAPSGDDSGHHGGDDSGDDNRADDHMNHQEGM
jgi:uncharacterized protein (DUF305 family)